MTVVFGVQMICFVPIKVKRNKTKTPRLIELTHYVGDKSSSTVSAAVVLHMRSTSRSSIVLVAGRDTKYFSFEHAIST